MRSIFIFLSVLMCLVLQAQTQAIWGTIKDAGGKPVFCTIYTTSFESFTETDTFGNYTLIVAPDDTIIFKALGYKLQHTTAKFIQSPVNIILEIDPVMIAPTTINGREAENLIKAVVRNLKYNYPTDPYIYNGFYRQSHRQDGIYVRLIEACADIYDAGYTARPPEKVALNQLRRSGMYETNGDNHDDHFIDLIAENWLHYRRGTPFDTTSLQVWHLSMDTTDHGLPDTRVLTFRYKSAHDKIARHGRIFIDMTDTAVYRIEEGQQYNKGYVKPAYSTGSSDWIFRFGGSTLEYKKQDGRYYTSHLSKWYTHRVSDHPYPGEWTIDEYFDLWVDSLMPAVARPADDFSTFSNIYSKRYKYDAEWWNRYDALKNYAVSPVVLKDLDAFQPLDKQFEREGGLW